jgi:hypothetical protein
VCVCVCVCVLVCKKACIYNASFILPFFFFLLWPFPFLYPLTADSFLLEICTKRKRKRAQEERSDQLCCALHVGRWGGREVSVSRSGSASSSLSAGVHLKLPKEKERKEKKGCKQTSKKKQEVACAHDEKAVRASPTDLCFLHNPSTFPPFKHCLLSAFLLFPYPSLPCGVTSCASCSLHPCSSLPLFVVDFLCPPPHSLPVRIVARRIQLK